MKMLLVAVGLAGVALGAVGVIAYESVTEDTSVTVDYEPPKSRAEYLRLWKEELAETGGKLPADVDQMTKQEIMEAWSKLFYRDAQPS
jgi:hypothetical protein